MKKLAAVLFISVLYLACSRSFETGGVDNPHSLEIQSFTKENYLPVLTELHQIECTYSEIHQSFQGDSALYAFRASAFHKLIMDPDRRILAHYEDLCQKVATIEYTIEGTEKDEYMTEKRRVYEAGCK
ncbi:MAG TPA: hypothetical protein PLU53_10175 [Bacteroidia bacterium]|nr:hypothetical protein [Bacteroidia bacterium]